MNHKDQDTFIPPNEIVFVNLYISRSSRPEVFRACNFIKKEALAQVFSCEFWEISKNTFPYRTPMVAVSV